MAEQQQIPIQPVELPIICSPYDEPNQHWVYDPVTGVPSRFGKRRPAGYWFKEVRAGSAQAQLFAEEHRDDLPLVNALRDDVARWREVNYRGASQVTRDLLHHWADPKRPRRLFFCQREAVETILYLAELRIPGRSSRTQFKNFQLSDDDLARLLQGEKPQGFALTGKLYPTLIDKPGDDQLLPLRRLGCKMATGSGKTVVMAMLIAWAFCNRGTNRESAEFPHAVLVCCPNLTVKERLQVLRPEHPENYYAAFDLVPVKYRPLLSMGKVLVENWHGFSPESEHREGDRSYAVVNKGPETHETLARRVLGDDIFARMPILVLNDEGHHCWRPASEDEQLTAEERRGLEEEEEEARVWLEGLDRINNAPAHGRGGVLFCVDLSATPFYIKGSGHSEGLPFPWLVSDFGLVDAIESGIVKIPRLPVRDDSGGRDPAGRPDPKYFRLWQNITTGLRPTQKHGSGKPKAEIVYERAHGALVQIAGQWVERFKKIQFANPDQEHIPPVLIIVCDNTDIADIFFRKISGEREEDVVTMEDIEEAAREEDEENVAEGRRKKPKTKTVYGRGEVFPDYLSNTRERKHTIRIDSKLLAEAESEEPGKTRHALAEELRKVVATVGRRGQPGEYVRCVVSVSMLTEGWDANNVTHILGIRAFDSQLLCEQVVGRGLRRISYDPDPNTGRLTEEYADVYGIPFTVIPFKGRAVDQPAPEDRPRNHVRALPDRAELEIRFPVVEGYVFALRKNLLRCDVGAVERIDVDPRLEPTESFLQAASGYQDQARPAATGFDFVRQTRQSFYEHTHSQTIQFQLAQRIVDELLSPTHGAHDTRSKVLRLQSRHLLFPQVLKIVQAFTAQRVNYNGVDERELGVEKYARLIVERLREAIEPDSSQGEPPLVPVLNRYRPMGTSAGVDFMTVRPVCHTRKSQVNAVVQDSGWEGAAAQALEACAAVLTYARNDHMGLTIAYEYLGAEHTYEPDFIVRLVNGLQVLLEIKGYDIHEPERTNSKHNAARRWVTAVNNLGDFGRWDFVVCRELNELRTRLELMAATHLPSATAKAQAVS